jgi:uncharacterized membrane protein
MMLAALSKPPTVACVLLQAMRWPFKDLPRHWHTLAIIVLPGLIAMLAWTIVTAGDVAAWRIVELTGNAPKQFDPAWKFGFMVDHPLHFPAAVMGTFKDTAELWRQLIGVLGLFDTVLQPWTYPAISILLVVACLTPVELSFATRHWIAAVAAMTGAAYCLAVFLIFYLIWTPTDADQVWGVQGRYFVPAVPLFAVVLSCLLNRGPGEQTRGTAALGCATLSGVASIEAILRVDLRIWGA